MLRAFKARAVKLRYVVFGFYDKHFAAKHFSKLVNASFLFFVWFDW